MFFSLTISRTLLVPEEFLNIQQAVVVALNGDTVSVNFGRPNGQHSIVISQQIIGKAITFEIRGEGKKELLRMINGMNNLPINKNNRSPTYPPLGWQGQGWVNRPDTNSTDQQPCLAIDSLDFPWVVWHGYGSNYSLAYTKWNGVNWDEEKGVGHNAPGVGYRIRPSISFDNQNIAWSAWDNAFENNNSDIATSHWDDTSWTSEIQVNLPDSTELDFAPRISCGGGQIWCVWYGGPTSVSPYTVFASRWNGMEWEPDMEVSPPDGFHHWFCSVAVDATGTPHVVWCGYPHYLVYYSYCSGSSWTEPMVVNDTTVVLASPWADPRISIDSDGNLNVCWTGALVGASHRDIFYSKYDGIQWSPAIKISQDSLFDEWYSDIAVDRPDNIWITWDRQNEGPDEFRVYASHFDGTSWSEETRLDNDTSYYDAGTDVHLNSQGEPWVCFQGIPYTANNFDIFYNRFISGGAISEEPTLLVKSALFSKVLPNPFSSGSKISYRVITPSYVELKIYSLNGRCIKTLVREYKAEGEYITWWDGRNANNSEVSAGIYFCQLWIGEKKEVTKIIKK